MRPHLVLLIIAIVAVSVASGPASGHHAHHHHGGDSHRYVELSYPINNQTMHWITMRDISYQVLADGLRPRPNNNGTYYVKSDRLEMDLHSGTHMDAPIHFAQGKWSIDQIPLENLLDVRTFIVDLSAKCKNDRKYQFTKEDFVQYETENRLTIAKKSLVLVYTGLSDLWPKGAQEYFGTDSKDPSKLEIPSFTSEAADFLANEREIVGVGLDAPSADGSKSYDSSGNMNPLAHEIFNGASVYIIENVNANLKTLSDPSLTATTSVRVCSLPLPIETASASPIRLIATLRPLDSDTNSATPTATGSSGSYVFLGLLQVIVTITMHVIMTPFGVITISAN